MNLFYGVTALPSGVFGVMNTLEHIGRSDFLDGKASFVFCPAEDSD